MYRRRKVNKEQNTQKEQAETRKTLEDFGYKIKENGEIRSIDADEPYNFDIEQGYDKQTNHKINEKHYEKFIDLIGDEVEKRLVSEPFNFQKKIVPLNANPETDPYNYIYMSPNAMTTTGKLLVCIPGIQTRIGQWSRRVMCDENIQNGSMIQVIKLVKEKGYEVIILNPNANYWINNKAQNSIKPGEKPIVIPENETPEAHCVYAFKHIITKTRAEKIAVMAMGWGGHCFTEVLDKEYDFIKEHVKAVALTDSAHMASSLAGKRVVYFADTCINWVASEKKKGEDTEDKRFGCSCISSGQNMVDFTLGTMLDDIMYFIFTNMGDIEKVVNEDEEKDLQDVYSDDMALLVE